MTRVRATVFSLTCLILTVGRAHALGDYYLLLLRRQSAHRILRGRVPAACSFYDNEYDRAEGALSIRVSNPGPEQCREGSDIHAILHGYVSIGEVRSPLF